MNRAIFEQAQSAYNNNDFGHAIDLFNTVATDPNFPLQPGEHGLVYHQIGNCLIKQNNYSAAINAYTSAASDNAYISNGTVFYNLGMAYAFLNDFGNAVKNFQTAINTPNYRSKYKAYTAMGNALMKSGKPAEAGVVFRNAALDEHNPDPTRALLNLGVCFMALNRPNDAVTVYESAFQFNMPDDLRNRLYANLGQAYVASGEMQKAISAFENALRDKSYVLSDSASVDYQRAIAAVSKGNESVNLANEGTNAAKASGMQVGEAVAAGAVAGVVASAANANQAQAVEPSAQNLPAQDEYAGFTTENYMPNSDQSAFAQPVEAVQVGNGDTDKDFEKWTESTKEAAYNPQEKKHPGKVVLIIFLSLLAAAIIAGSVLFCFGFGFPTQEMVVNEFFSNPIESKDKVFSDRVSDTKKTNYTSMISQDTNPTIKGVKRSVNESVVYVTGKTSQGGEIEYKIKMVRDILGWKIQVVDLAFASNE